MAETRAREPCPIFPTRLRQHVSSRNSRLTVLQKVTAVTNIFFPEPVQSTVTTASLVVIASSRAVRRAVATIVRYPPSVAHHLATS